MSQLSAKTYTSSASRIPPSTFEFCEKPFPAHQHGLPNTKMTKRKLDEKDMPSGASAHDMQNNALKFPDLKLDPRLLRAVSKEKFTKPTPVQAEAIPLALAGKDILG